VAVVLLYSRPCLDEESQAANVTPTVLIISACPSFSPARLSMALAKCGFNIVAVCPPHHILRRIPAVKKVFSYHSLMPLRSVSSAIRASNPALVIPCDDWSASLLHRLYLANERRPEGGGEISNLIERSLGSPVNFQTAYDRAHFLELARNERLRVPESRAISCSEDLGKWTKDVGFPAVLKANSTSGGEGVRIVSNLEEAERTLLLLQKPPMIAKALKRVLIDQDMALLWPSLLRLRYTVSIQAFVRGRDATSAVACWNGKVLASLHFEVVHKQDKTGPSTVLRLIENKDMSTAAERMARRLGLSGLHGFDFILETATENAYLIEINPRATQVGHMALGEGRDLPAALFAALTGASDRVRQKATDKDMIALFPQEWLRNPESEYLRSAYHDVPWEEPEYIFACIEKRQKQLGRSPLQKWVQAISKKARET
jgi:Carbamoyl-phosphate synthase L chain, ATP binding domain